jgi:DNA-binding response OmpR family regulator
MKTTLMETRRAAGELPPPGIDRFQALQQSCRTILAITQDAQFLEQLRSAANSRGTLVVKAERAAGAALILQVTRPDIVLLDLDLPNDAAWHIAESLLHEPSCSPVLLLSRRTERFDTHAALRAGSVVNKSDSADHLLELIDDTLQKPEPNQAERNTIQLVFLRWLRPSAWEIPTNPPARFWGINE